MLLEISSLSAAGNDSEKICGEGNWKPTFSMTSTSNNILIRLVSDGYDAKYGFVFSFSATGKRKLMNLVSSYILLTLLLLRYK